MDGAMDGGRNDRSAARGALRLLPWGALLLLLLLLPAGCVTEHYQILPDWTEDDAVDGGEDDAEAESDDDVEHPEGEDDADEDDGDDEDDVAAPVCVEETDGGLPCPAGFVCCEADPVSYCYDLSSDPDHCGSCDLECESGRECVSGRCGEP